MTYLFIFISAVFVNNIVLSQFLGVRTLLEVSRKIDTALSMSGAVALIMTLATITTYIIQKTVLEPFNIGFLQTMTFIVVIVVLLQLMEIVLKKTLPAFYKTLDSFWPLITTNCTILGVAILVVQKDFSLLESVVFAISSAAGFGLALIVFAGIREQLQMTKLPKGIDGSPILLITAGLLAMAFMGFAGIVK